MTDIPKPPEGIQPSFHDRVYPVRGGTSIKLANGQEDGVSNQAEFVTDWVVKIRPAAASIALATSENWGVRGALTVNYDGDQFLEYQPIVNPDQALFLLPITGICIGVHGRYINLRFKREIAGGSGEIGIEACITPGRLSRWYKSDFGPTDSATPAKVPIPVFATRFQVLSTFDAGDSIDQLGPDGASVLQHVTLTAGLVEFLQPIHPFAALLRYNTTVLAAKTAVFGFEVVS